MLKMPAILLKVMLNAMLLMCTFLLGDLLKLLINGCLQGSNSARVALGDVVLKESPEEEIRWGSDQASAVPILLQLCG